MNVVDSSGWLEYFADGANAGFFEDAVKTTTDLIVPVVCLYEVFKRVSLQRGEGPALQAVAIMQQGRVVELTASIALRAASISLERKLPMADSLILATAHEHGATLWTQDADFAGMTGIEYVAKVSASD